MRTKQARQPVAVESQQLTLFSLFDAQNSENPLTQALPAGGRRHSRSRVGSLPEPSSSGPAFSENPTTTALYGRPQGDSDLPKDRSPVHELGACRTLPLQPIFRVEQGVETLGKTATLRLFVA